MTSTGFVIKQQQCSTSGLALSWLAYLVGLAYFVYLHRWTAALIWLVLVPCVRLILFRSFPRISRFLGYGRIIDALPLHVDASPVAVTFYSFFSCPFCPIVLRRLEALQKTMNFSLQKIDVTLHPQLLFSKRIQSVPVVEIAGDRLVGNVTTEDLAAFIGLVRPLQLRTAASSA
jgi:glutaredoxin